MIIEINDFANHAIQRKYQQLRDTLYWTARMGDLHLIKDMTDYHIFFALASGFRSQVLLLNNKISQKRKISGDLLKNSKLLTYLAIELYSRYSNESALMNFYRAKPERTVLVSSLFLAIFYLYGDRDKCDLILTYCEDNREEILARSEELKKNLALIIWSLTSNDKAIQ